MTLHEPVLHPHHLSDRETPAQPKAPVDDKIPKPGEDRNLNENRPKASNAESSRVLTTAIVTEDYALIIAAPAKDIPKIDTPNDTDVPTEKVTIEKPGTETSIDYEKVAEVTGSLSTAAGCVGTAIRYDYAICHSQDHSLA